MCAPALPLAIGAGVGLLGGSLLKKPKTGQAGANAGPAPAAPPPPGPTAVLGSRLDPISQVTQGSALFQQFLQTFGLGQRLRLNETAASNAVFGAANLRIQRRTKPV